MSINLLLVDSDNKIRDSVAAIIHKRYDDVQILEAQDGEEAIQILSAEGDYVDTVILGTEMPATDGWEVLYVIKDRDNWPSMPVVMLVTEDRVWDDALRAHTLGAEHFVTKPVSTHELMTVLDNILVGETV